MIVLGLNVFHGDAAAALLRDGKLVAAVEEERFRRVKHWAGFPERSIAYCLREAGLSIGDVDHLAINQDNRANLSAKFQYTLTRLPDVRLILERLRTRRARGDVIGLMERSFPEQRFRGRFHRVEHHVAHLSSAFHASPFERAAVISVDGFGDFASAAWGIGEGGRIDVSARAFFPHSLGVFYQAITQFLGFPHYGDEFKVMGLAAHGEPAFMDEMRELVLLEADGSYRLNLRYFCHHRKPVAWQWSGGRPEFADLFAPALEALLGARRRPGDPIEQRHRDIACSAQAMYEAAFFNLLAAVQKQSGLTDLALAGGCAMNSVANGKIQRKTPFQRVYVPPAAGDAGGAVGAALAVWHRLGGARIAGMNQAFWGPQFDEPQIAGLIAKRRDEIAAVGCEIETISDEPELCRRAASMLADGRILGWFQGRMELGPRALGNRSILCDPRRADASTRLNETIKRRESFRPFAPSILEEFAAEWFELEHGQPVPFMSQVFGVRAEKRAAIPAVVHVDGSGRLQTVSKAANPRFHRLISAFAEAAGVPMLLNTSFNENEPIVCAPAEALDCFLRSGMDALVLGDTFVVRRA